MELYLHIRTTAKTSFIINLNHKVFQIMDEYYIGEIRIFGAGFAPWGWHICDGSLILIEQNTALFSLLGTTYGGDGLKTFALPDLRSRIPLGMSSLRPIGTIGGAERVTLGVENLPSHRHTPACNNTDGGNFKDATNAFWAASAQNGMRYGQAPGSVRMSGESILPEGGYEPHENRMPVIALTYGIAITGKYPIIGTRGYGLTYPAEIRMFAFADETEGYVVCDGRTYPVNPDDQLFRLIGSTFGKEEGRYKLPDLRDRVLIGSGPAHPAFSTGGEDAHKLTVEEMPKHRHKTVTSSNKSDSPSPKEHFWPAEAGYTAQNNSVMNDQAVEAAGGGVAHDNMSPFLTINYTICTDGMYTDGQFQPVEEYLGTIRAFATKVTSGAWLPCDGRELPIASNNTLFSLLNTRYGGNGTTTFALPDLRGRAAVQYSYKNPNLTAYELGEKAGVETVSLTVSQMPGHSHAPLAAANASSQRPEGQVWANEDRRPSIDGFATAKGTGVTMSAAALGEAGGDQPHNNMMPYLGIEYMICCLGIYPSHG